MNRSAVARVAFGVSLLLVSTISSIAHAADVSYDSQRAVFLQARAALQSGNQSEFTRLRAQLDDYPIVEFLDYEQHRKFFAQPQAKASDLKKIADFHQRYQNSSLTRRLTLYVQSRFARQEKWQDYTEASNLEFARANPCRTLASNLVKGTQPIWDDAAVTLWSEPGSRSESCRNALVKLEAAKVPPVSAIWTRVYRAMEEDKPAFAKPVLHYLSTKDRTRVQQWIDALSSPESFLNSGVLAKNTQLNRRMFVDLVLAWSKHDPVAAMNHWLENHPKYGFYPDRYYDTHRLLAMRGAYRRLPEAYQWLNSLQARDDDLELKEWRVRAALYAQDWLSVLKEIKRLPKQEQVEDHWAYWEARAFEESGHTELAVTMFEQLSQLATYYGFLAADKVGKPYAIQDVPIVVADKQLEALASDDRLIRAREYYAVLLNSEGRREWNNAMLNADTEQLAAMAVLAEQWGLVDRAIFSAGKAEKKQALSLRFPIAYLDAVEQQAQKNTIEPAWAFGVMRRESAFIHDIVSSAGAVGLMQLMPNTAKYVAKLQGDKNWKGDLTDANTNIGFGTFYLRHVLDKFDDHQVLATASYNAGPRRVGIWLPPEDMQADVWIDAIPYTETRRYVRAVMAYTAIYEWHMKGEPTRLSERLVTVPAATDEARAIASTGS